MQNQIYSKDARVRLFGFTSWFKYLLAMWSWGKNFSNKMSVEIEIRIELL